MKEALDSIRKRMEYLTLALMNNESEQKFHHATLEGLESGHDEIRQKLRELKVAQDLILQSEAENAKAK